MRILVVDDDDFSGEMTAAVLADAGYETVTVDSGVEAVEALASDPGIAAVVSDMNMPFISGLDLFAALREEGCTQPFILLSGENPDVLRQREPRLDACVAKDSHLEHTLLQALDRVLAVRS